MAMTLDEFVAGVRSACGADLLSMVLYGSAAGRDYHGPESGHNVLVLARDVSTASLHAMSGVVQKWMKAGNPPPLLLTAAEWRASADVFSMEYADVLERHRVLTGEFPTQGIQVRRHDIRQQLETESMGKLLRLRRGVMSAGDDAKVLRALLDDALPSMLALFRATVRMHGEPVPASSEALCDRVAALVGFPPAEFRAVLAQRRGTKLTDPEVRESLRGYHEALEKLVAHVDAFAVND
jgi:hypothetical protein